MRRDVGYGLEPAVDAKLPEDVLDVVPDGGRADVEPVGHGLGVRPARHQPENLDLPARQRRAGRLPDDGRRDRLGPGPAHDFEVDINDDTVGLERMLTIAVEAQRGQERADFSFLGQSPLAATRGAATRSEDTDVMAFMDAGFSAYRTRAASVAPRAPSARTAMQVFTFNIAR